MELDRDLDCLAPPDGLLLYPVRPPVLYPVRPPDLDATLGNLPHAAFLRASGFRAEAGQLVLIPGKDGEGDALDGAVLGLGDDRSPWPFGGLATGLPPGTDWRLAAGDYDPGTAALGFCLGAYRFPAFKEPKPIARLVPPPGAEAGLRLARATWLVRDLINLPANHLGPEDLAEVAAALGRRFGATVDLHRGEALDQDYPALAAVGRGSARPPVVAVLHWSGAGPEAPLVSLCGKGVVFDSGGLDLKPSAAMLRMKKDMGGAALMLGLARLVMEANLPVRLAVRIGCAENLAGSHAMRPLDVLPTRAGITVEVGNTDAEGRLVLADLLAEAAEERPDLLLDAATLTGAARAALGPDLPALFTPDDALAGRLLDAGQAAHDPLWRLPLWDGYVPWLASPVADSSTTGSKPMAGAITAALFLRRFVPDGIAWAHLDTYAWNDAPRPGRPEGGEALGLRALFGALSCLNR